MRSESDLAAALPAVRLANEQADPDTRKLREVQTALREELVTCERVLAEAGARARAPTHVRRRFAGVARCGARSARVGAAS
jgi:hypothetical protein